MNVLATVALAMAMAGGADPPTGRAAATADAAARCLSVRLHDYAGLNDDELRVTERQVSEIYATVGVLLEWRLPVHPNRVKAGIDQWPADPPATLTVLILSLAMAHGIGLRDDVAGYAAVNRNDGGTVAYVVADRTRRIADTARLSHARVVSGVVAHELAHLLMPNRPHSHDGIMRARWKPLDFRFPLRRAFSAAEGEIIRRGVARLSRLTQHADN